ESGTRRDRTLYMQAQDDRAAWDELQREHRFDFALLDLHTPTELRGFIESDPVWAAVFIDDAAAVFVRRDGPLRPVAEQSAYRRLRVSAAALQSVMTLCQTDTTLRREVRRELERQVRESPWTAVAHELNAVLADMDGRAADAAEERARADTARRLFRLPDLSARG